MTSKGPAPQRPPLRAGLASLHFGEEPPLVMGRGSGTFFLSGCNLRCPFCQNWQISRGLIGESLSTEKAAQICLKLQEAGAANINFVTGSHYVRQIIDVIKEARAKGLSLPILWNSSAYETLDILNELKDYVDIWLPDLKTVSPGWAEKIYGKENYASRAAKAVRFMVNNTKMAFDKEGMMTSGVIIRHLIIPGCLGATEELLAWYAREAKDKALLSLLSQYTPVTIPGETRAIPRSYLSEEEYNRVLELLDEHGIDDGFIQELETGSDWLPDFREDEPFDADLSRVIWKAGE